MYFYIIFIAFFWVKVVVSGPGLLVNVPPTQINALHDLYVSGIGEFWRWRPASLGHGIAWNFKTSNPNPCTGWQGVNCSMGCYHGNAKLCTINSLNLTAYNVSGTIPPSISNLNNLTVLSLALNRLTGTIPSSIGLIPSLQVLELGSLLAGTVAELVYIHLQVRGNISDAWGSTIGGLSFGIEGLIAEYIANNKLVGPIPSELGKLSALTSLDLSHNGLTGTIPSFVSKLSQLVNLNLAFNELSGDIPTGIGQLSKCKSLVMSGNVLNGTIPTEIGQMSSMQILGFSFNYLVGTLPTELGQLSSLTLLGLFGNKLYGTLIPHIANVTSLVVLSLGSNFFTGTIPRIYCRNLTQIFALSLNGNNLVGSIPTEIGYMATLNLLFVYGNLLSGPIPNQINSTDLFWLAATSNYLSSTIPSELFNLSDLVYIDLGVNALSGSIPSSVGDMSILMNCSLFNVSMASNTSIIDWIANYTWEEIYAFGFDGGGYIALSLNYLTGTIPSSLTKLSCLGYLLLFGNSLTGPIPSGIGNMQNLNVLLLNDNHLTGQILPEVTEISKLVQFSLNNNILTGPIPTNMSAWINMRSFDIGENYLTGGIPDDFNQCIALATLSVYSNYLSGSIPLALANIIEINELLVSGNFLSGSLTVFDSLDNLSFMMMDTFDGSGNEFTGTIPETLYSLPLLKTVALTKNCFQGSISAGICQSNLRAITLNGLSSGKTCRIPLFTILHTYTSHYMDGTIPSCIFEMDTLISLQLSGNGLAGSLPNVDRLPENLLNISLSNNRLSGTIPEAFTAGTLTALDLRSNAFEGTCDHMDNFFVSTRFAREANEEKSLALSLNRLSGNLPASFRQASNIDVLAGNLFGCNDKSELPSNDPHLRKATCGSASLTGSLIGFSSFFVIFVITVCVVAYPKGRSSQNKIPPNDGQNTVNRQSTDSFRGSLLWGDIHGDEANEIDREIILIETEYFMRMMIGVRSVAQKSLAIIIVVLLPIYLALKLSNNMAYTTHSYQYALFPAATYLRGFIPAIVLLALTLVLALLLQFQILTFTSSLRSTMEMSLRQSKHISWKHIDFVYRTQSSSLIASSSSSVSMNLPSRGLFQRIRQFMGNNSIWLKNMTFIIVDIILISIINGGFVLVILTQGQANVLLAELSLACIKVYWNIVLMPRILEIINSKKPQVVRPSSRSESDASANVDSTNSAVPPVPLTLSHSVGRAIKLDIQAGLSIFNSVVSPITCLLVDGNNCFLHTFIQTETITSTAYFTTCTDVTSHCRYFPHRLSSTFVPPFLYSFQCSSEFIRDYSMVFVFMYMYLVVVRPVVSFYLAFVYLKTPQDAHIGLRSMVQDVFNSNSILQPRAPAVTLVKEETAVNSLESRSGKEPSTGNQSIEDARFRQKVFDFVSMKYLNVDKTTAKLMVDLAVLVTFGFAYVPLGCIVCVSIIVTCIEWRVMMTRCCMLYDRCAEFRTKPFDSLRCEGVIDNFARFQWIFVLLLCWFFAFFVFDTSNGDYGSGAWASIILIFWPFLLWGIAYIKNRLFPQVKILDEIDMVSNQLASSLPNTKPIPTRPTVYVQDTDTITALRHASALNGGIPGSASISELALPDVDSTSFNSDFAVSNPIVLSNETYDVELVSLHTRA